jgi:hypothetical protein
MGLPAGIFGRCGVALAAVSVAVGLLLVAPPAFAAADRALGAPKDSVAIPLSAQPAAGSDSETTEAVAGADLSDDTNSAATDETAEPEGDTDSEAAPETAVDESDSTEVPTVLVASSGGSGGSSGWLYFWLALAVIAVIGIGVAAYTLGARRRSGPDGP